MTTRIMRLMVLSLAVIAGACGDDGGSMPPDAPDTDDAAPPDSPPADAAIDAPDSSMIDAAIDAAPTVTSLTLDATNVSVADGLTVTVTASAMLSDGSSVDVTNLATWMTMGAGTATVVNGVITGVAPGNTTVTASYMGQSDDVAVTVTAAVVTALAITPDGSMVCDGDTITLTATATRSDGGSGVVTPMWMSMQTGIATIDVDGDVLGVSAGTATISASYIDPVGGGTTNDTTTVMVTAACLESLVISGAANVTAGLTTNLTAQGTFTDGGSMDVTEMVTWTSLPTSTATVSDAAGTKGRVTGVAAGTATITATSGAVSDDFSITVDPPAITSIMILPDGASIPNTSTQQLMVIATFTTGPTQDVASTASYSVAPPGIATVNSTGLVTPVAGQAGTVTITASAGGQMDTTMLTVTSTAAPAISITGPTGMLTAGGTEAGGMHAAGAAYTRMYTIMNTGTANLTVTSVTFPTSAAPVNCTQTLMMAPVSPVIPNGTTTFVISTTHPAAGPANCPFLVTSNAANAPTFLVDRGVTATPPLVEKKSAVVSCGQRTASGFTTNFLAGSVSEFTPDGTMTTTTIGSCIVQVITGGGNGGTNVAHGADMATCMGTSTTQCTESMNACAFGGLGPAPFAGGGNATLTITDTLLGGTRTQAFTNAPGALTANAIPATQSRSTAMSYTASGGEATAFIYTTISQNNGAIVAVCEAPGNATTVTIPANVLANFQDGQFFVSLSHQKFATQTHNGYDVVFQLNGDVLGAGGGNQMGTFTP